MIGDGVGEIRALVRTIREKLSAPAERPHAGDALSTECLSHSALLPLHRLLRCRAQPAWQLRNDEPHVD